MGKIVIFGGTTEGREAAARAIAAGQSVLVSVTSEYARQFLPPAAACHVGALDAAGMRAFLMKAAPDEVIDATHPFAVTATQTIRACADALHIPYRRSLRTFGTEEAWQEDVAWVDTPQEAASVLTTISGNILLTTGSNTLHVYAGAIQPERLYVRVLPTLRSLQACMDAGIPSSHILAMQGPFSRDMNAATYDQLHIRAMVSKDSGDPGGVTDKVLPALQREITVIMLRRPKEENDAR